MLGVYKTFKFRYAYHLAGRVYDLIEEDSPDEYLRDHFDPNDEIFRQRILKPQKDTILHEFIDYYWDDDNFYVYSKIGDDEWFKGILRTYGMKIPRMRARKDDYDKRRNYSRGLYELTKEVAPLVVDEAFTILFNNRMFLLKFNSIISEVIRAMRKDEFPDLMAKNGVVKRCTYLPVWLRNGVFHRDRGRCQVCGKDLTGLVVLGQENHFDHIIPLKKGGTNDPTNFQLLCREHNLDKGGTKIITSEKYQAFW